jgi:hypothetical protein
MLEIIDEIRPRKQERSTFRERVVFWFGIACLVLLVGIATNAYAAPLFKNTGNDGKPISLRLLDTPCTNPKVKAHLEANVKAQFIPQFKSAVLHYGGRDWASCWIEYEGAVLSYDEEGAPFNPPMGVPRSMFKEDSV